MTVLPSRRAQIIRLLETRDQHLPEPSRRQTAAVAGFAHDTLAPAVCPVCEGVDDHCNACRGRGSVEVRRDRDPYAENKTVQYGLTGAQHDAGHRRDREIDRLEQQTRPAFASAADELAEANAHPYSWEIARQRMLRQFDYAPLDAALEIVRLIEEPGYRLLHRVFVYRIIPEPSASSSAGRLLEHSLVLVDGLMPTHIRAPEAEKPVRVVAPVSRTAGKPAYAKRDEQAKQMAAAGASVADICAATGLKKSQVYAIVNGGLA